MTPITVRKSRAIQCRDPFFLFSKATRCTRALQTPIRTVSLTYPQARDINYTYDALNRVTLIKDGSNIINQYLYVGPRRMSERKYVKASDGSTEVTSLHAVYDPSALLRTGGVAAITRWYHDKSNNSVAVGFQYGRDKVGNPSYEHMEHMGTYGDSHLLLGTYGDSHLL